MILTRLAGGIGNQMFHYAVARAAQRDDAEPIVLDTRLLRDLEADIENIVQRPFALDIFPNLQATPIDADLCRMLDGMRLIDRVRRKWFKRRTTYVYQHTLEPVAVPARRRTNLFLLGNFQSEQYFAAVRPALLAEFGFPGLDAKNAALERTIVATPDAVSVHVRRGDYLSSSNRDMFTSVTLDYYEKALSALKSRLGATSFDIFLFTDDIDWATQHFPQDGLRIHHVEGNAGADSWKDMRLMAACQHHVIANSSFSWWGAWLAQRPGINLAPRYWFRPNTYSFDIEHIVPRDWTVVDYALDAPAS